MAFLGIKKKNKLVSKVTEIEKNPARRILEKVEGIFPMILRAAQHKLDYPEMYVKKEVRPCPECKKGILIERQGKFGDFIGCTGYPSCKYTEKI